MEDYPELISIINWFTSLELLLAFAHYNGIEEDPYVKQRANYIRSNEGNEPSIKCTYCGALFKTLEHVGQHQALHEAVNDFDLSLLDNPSTDLDNSPSPAKNNVSKLHNLVQKKKHRLSVIT